jgi:hypothetical protein
MKIVDANRKIRLAIETFRNTGGGGLRQRIAHFMGIARGGGQGLYGVCRWQGKQD